MPSTPSHIVKRADGREAGAVYDLTRQGKVGLQVEDDELAAILAEHGILPPRPPFLDAGHGGVHGAYAPRPQRNWFLAPPVDGVLAALREALGPRGYVIEPA